MKRNIFPLLAIIVMSMLVANSSIASEVDSYSSTIDVFQQSLQVQPYFENSYGYAVFPTVGKGSFGVGGTYGTGQVYRGGEVTAITKVMKMSVGFQAGVQVFSQIIFFEDEKAYNAFTRGQYELSAQLSAVAITAGGQAQAGSTGATAGMSAGPKTGIQANTNYYKGMVVFVHAKGGLMFEAAVAGQKFSTEPL
jgi:lipid-binding SYLF domain-containing protein